MLVNKVEEYIKPEYDLNCAETILTAANEEYNLGLDKKALKLMAGFGGGLGTGSVCGVLTASAAVLSAIFVEDRGHEGPLIKELMGEYTERFKVKLSSDICLDLKKTIEDHPMRCKKIIIDGAEVLQELILERI